MGYYAHPSGAISTMFQGVFVVDHVFVTYNILIAQGGGVLMCFKLIFFHGSWKKLSND